VTKHVVLVVHGIGEQEPGHTVDQVLGGAIAEHERQGGAEIDVQHVAFLLPEIPYAAESDAATRKAALFPLHTRRVRPTGAATTQETVLAEVYWADKSPAPRGPLMTVFDFILLIMGLGYMAMENVENTRGKVSQAVVHAFIVVVFGVLAPLNAMSLVYSLFGLTLEQWNWIDALPSSAWAVGVGGVLTLGLGIALLLLLQRTYLQLLFSWGLVVLAVLTVIFAFLCADGRYNSPGLPGYDFFPELRAYFATLTGLNEWMLAFAILLCATTYFIWFFRFGAKYDDAGEGQRQIFAPVCSAMLLFYFMALSSFWLTFQHLISRTNSGYFTDAFVWDRLRDNVGFRLF